MARPVPIYPAEGSILDNVQDFFQHHERQTQNIQRSLLGLGKNAPLPGKPDNLPYPRLVYRPDYFTAQDNTERRNHYREVDNAQEAKEAEGEGFFGSLQDAKSAFEAQQKKDEKKK